MPGYDFFNYKEENVSLFSLGDHQSPFTVYFLTASDSKKMNSDPLPAGTVGGLVSEVLVSHCRTWFCFLVPKQTSLAWGACLGHAPSGHICSGLCLQKHPWGVFTVEYIRQDIYFPLWFLHQLERFLVGSVSVVLESLKHLRSPNHTSPCFDLSRWWGSSLIFKNSTTAGFKD